MTDRYYIFIEI